MNPVTELQRKLENLCRPGHVIAVDPATALCRVESGGLQTDWLPWITLRAGSDRTWWPPSVDEQVLLLCPGGNPANGIVLMGLYSDANPAPGDSLSLVVLALLRDGTRITYDADAHHLQADLAGSATLTSVGDVIATVGGNATLTAAGDITATADGNITATAEGDLSATAANITATTPGALTAQAETAAVTATSITLTGAVTINGPLQLNGPLAAVPGAAGGGATLQGNLQVTGDLSLDGSTDISGDVTAVNVNADQVVATTEVTANGVTLTSRAPAA